MSFFRLGSSFDKLVDMDKSFCIHHQNIQKLFIEVYKAFHNNSAKSWNELFVRIERTINLRSKPELAFS